jgi:hypothetical protein
MGKCRHRGRSANSPTTYITRDAPTVSPSVVEAAEDAVVRARVVGEVREVQVRDRQVGLDTGDFADDAAERVPIASSRWGRQASAKASPSESVKAGWSIGSMFAL